MTCKKCRASIPAESRFCLKCGFDQSKTAKVSARAKRSTFYFRGRQYESVGKTQREADQKAALKLEKLKNGVENVSGSMTVARWANIWLKTYKEPKLGVGSYKNYELFIKRIIVPAIGAQKLNAVKDVQLQNILNEKAGMSRSYLTKLRMYMKAMFQRAVKSRLIPYNPADGLELPASVEGTRRRITDDERTLILKLANTHHAGLWIKLTLYCGLRLGEARALDWRHIDFEKNLINVEAAMKSKTNDIGPPKSKAGERSIPVSLKLIPDLIVARGKGSEPVLTQPTTGRRHTETSMRCMWGSFKNGLDDLMGAEYEKIKAKDGKMRSKKVKSVVAGDLTPYCLRHTFATDLQDAGVPLNVARYLMGHDNISITSKIYTETTEKVINEAAKKINNMGKMENGMDTEPTKPDIIGF